MLNFMFLAALLAQVVTSGELQCLGFIHETALPMDIYIAGVGEEGVTAISSQGQLLYLNGRALSSVKPGGIYWVARPEGLLRERVTQNPIGYYYKELGTIRVEALEGESATARVVMSCQGMIKGDLVLPAANRPAVQFAGPLSNRLSPLPAQGLTSSIIVGKDDVQYLAAGHFCFIGVGARDGVKPGDRFTVFRPQPAFNIRDLFLNGSGYYMTYERVSPGRYPDNIVEMLIARKLPPRIMGDIVIIDVGETTAAAKVINSLEDIHLGDLVIRH